MTQVEEALRSQREAWHEVTQRVITKDCRALPLELPRRILLFGLGSSHFAARLTAQSLLRDKSRKRIPVVACSSMAVGRDVMPGPGDWAVGFSHRAGPGATRSALELCGKVGAYSLLICAEGVENEDFARQVVQTVPMERIEPHTISLTTAICAATTLLQGPRAMEEWDALRTLGEPDLDTCRERAGQGPTVILGEWEGEWLAREAALKLMEMAKIPVRAYGTEEYFHGPCSSETQNDCLWHICLPGDLRAQQLRPRYQVDLMGATPLAWVPALVELQWLSLAVALNRGVNPDWVKPQN